MFRDSVSKVLAEMQTDGDGVAVCTCVPGEHAWAEMTRLFVMEGDVKSHYQTYGRGGDSTATE